MCVRACLVSWQMEISDKFWADITQAERAAAITLGYDEDTWNYHGVEMPNVGLDDVRLYASAHAAIAPAALTVRAVCTA